MSRKTCLTPGAVYKITVSSLSGSEKHRLALQNYAIKHLGPGPSQATNTVILGNRAP